MEWQDTAIILSVRKHGETSAVVTLLSRLHGRYAGHVRGGYSKGKHGLLEIGSVVNAKWSARLEEQLGQFQLEPIKAHGAALMDDAIALSLLQSSLSICYTALPERETQTGVFDSLLALFDIIADAESWPELAGASYVFWEAGFLREVGYGLQLEKCAATGETDNLIYVSPKSGKAVSAVAGEPYKDKLFPLPQFLIGKNEVLVKDILDGMDLTGYFLEHRLYAAAYKRLPEARQRFIERFMRKFGEFEE